MSEPHEVEIGPVTRATHLFIACAGTLVVGFLAWSSIAILDVVSQASGEVVPSTQLKSIQHLEGGIVAEILVREGQAVSKDQPLVTLQATASGADVNEMSIRLVTLNLNVARLEAEAADKDGVVYPPEIVRTHSDLVTATDNLFRSRRGKLVSTLGGLQEALNQREQAAGEVEARLRNARNTLRHLGEQVSISESMIREGLSTRYTHLALLREQSALRSRIDEDEAALRRNQAAIKEARTQIETSRQSYRQEVVEQLAQARRDLDELSQRFSKVSDNLERTTIRSPVEGVVKTLYVATQGGVVKPGATVLDIVPAGDRLIVEAKLPTYDIGYVSLGQPARIRLASQDGVRFGSIDGSVVHIGPDSNVSEKGGSFYKVRIETTRDHFQHRSESYRLYPGMQVTAHIRTGERTVLAYFLEPFIGLTGSALKER
ncbi:hypothetical protein WV31_18050 [Magnetospirillum sp. ME-1]|uniref:HlyD family type I secretion periplasmic adaptor subunit n=1 Tax=Magnetospirillum sp. ME-1 TaxID=1639348 RepID=UPI000A17DC64|nr:HlyD family type I secretion periplasmic adaptor subunit [Magnetospirillum sp. ME-1]ARJ67430.1 hypothetical protein WV31_18050 [Magnetospirillum sp. ME-1]